MSQMNPYEDMNKPANADMMERMERLARSIDRGLGLQHEESSAIIHDYLIPTLTYAEKSFEVLNGAREFTNRFGKVCDRLVGPVGIGVALGIACMLLRVPRRVSNPVIHVVTPSPCQFDLNPERAAAMVREMLA